MVADKTLKPLVESLKDASALLRAAAETAPITFNRGMERETLRVTPSGDLALTGHPAFLGSKLTHPLITTDFCEAQPELITGIHASAKAALDELLDVHGFVSQGLTDELLWAASMPCHLPDDARIPLADYGTSNLGRLKKTYRNGLGLRYGRAMQTICAVHYNFSMADETLDAFRKLETPVAVKRNACGWWLWLVKRLWPVASEMSVAGESQQDYRTRRYFDLMRNFRHWSWLLTWLFGASPAVCRSFAEGKEHQLEPLDDDTLHLPFATSLRSGNLGYKSDLQSSHIDICYNDLGNYVGELARAICKTHPEYERAGRGPATDDVPRQANASILQSEAEFYSSVRAKRTAPPGTNALQFMKDKGVEYIEVRLLDLDPYQPLGIGKQAIDFIDTFLVACFLLPSPPHDAQLCKAVAANLNIAATRGRDPDATLDDRGQPRLLKDWGTEILNGLTPIAKALDEISGGLGYTDALVTQQHKMIDPDLTPSAKMLNDMRGSGKSFLQFALDKSVEHRNLLIAGRLRNEAHLNQLAEDSVAKHAAVEAQAAKPFDEYLRDHQAGYEALAAS